MVWVHEFSCSSERDRTSPVGPLEPVVKELPGRDKNWLTGPSKSVDEEIKIY
jgi:hypothetical protein